MNLRLVSRLLGVIAILIGATMIFSLPWAHSALGKRHGLTEATREWRGFTALLVSMAICFLLGTLLLRLGRGGGQLFRKEAMTVVGLSWVLATFLGAMPFWISGAQKAPGVQMTLVDCLFESQSGFSTTGATVITDLENSQLVPYCILFWRSSTHFLGGLGIVVLFVAILGQGSAGKALMRAEMPGPSKDGTQTRMQHTAWIFAAIYCALTLVLTLILRLLGMTTFDSLCHSFGTMATGGFSTYNTSIRHFGSPAIEYTIIVFMILAGTNFALLYALCLKNLGKLLLDVEWRTYISIIVVVTLLVVLMGIIARDFQTTTDQSFLEQIPDAVRYGLFQVVAILTTTGFGTDDFDSWNSFGRGVLFLLMFVGGCAGSTGGGMKVIRHILFHKILRLEIEQAFHPTVVRPLKLAGRAVDDPDLRHNILVYFGLVTAIFVFSWMFVVTVEPDATWNKPPVHPTETEIEITGEPGAWRNETNHAHKLIDAASAVAATLNNIGPGLGIVGPTRNYSNFSPVSKLLFTLLMMAGRVEIFAILVLFAPRFWRTQ